MGKRIENAKKLIDENKSYSLDEAISFFLKEYSEKYSAKFDETIEFILKLGIDAKQSDQNWYAIANGGVETFHKSTPSLCACLGFSVHAPKELRSGSAGVPQQAYTKLPVSTTRWC